MQPGVILRQKEFNRNIKTKTIELMLSPCPIVRIFIKGDKKLVTFRGKNNACYH